MNWDEYQKKARSMAVYPKASGTTYLALGLAGEAGEVANQVKKMIRDDGGEMTRDRLMNIVDELGDVLWYLTMLAEDIGESLEFIAIFNIMKLQERALRDQIHGDKRKS